MNTEDIRNVLQNRLDLITVPDPNFICDEDISVERGEYVLVPRTPDLKHNPPSTLQEATNQIEILTKKLKKERKIARRNELRAAAESNKSETCLRTIEDYKEELDRTLDKKKSLEEKLVQNKSITAKKMEFMLKLEEAHYLRTLKSEGTLSELGVVNQIETEL